jgi:hypothetical protein
VNIELWKLVISVGVVLVTTVTGPIIWAMRAEAKAIRAEMETLKAELKGEIAKTAAELKGEIVRTEARLNERIDTRLVHR